MQGIRLGLDTNAVWRGVGVLHKMESAWLRNIPLLRNRLKARLIRSIGLEFRSMLAITQHLLDAR